MKLEDMLGARITGYRCKRHGDTPAGTCDCPDLVAKITLEAPLDLSAAERGGGYHRCPTHGASAESCWCGAGEWMRIGPAPTIAPPALWEEVLLGALAHGASALGRVLGWVRR